MLRALARIISQVGKAFEVSTGSTPFVHAADCSVEDIVQEVLHVESVIYMAAGQIPWDPFWGRCTTHVRDLCGD